MTNLTKHHLFKLTESLRDFFKKQDFLETLTPPIVMNPGMETHLHPFQVYSAVKKDTLPLYLHTSPEFYMKKLLSEGLEKIYQISYVFRDEPSSATHRKQFLMLEWYRANSYYNDIKTDIQNLVSHASQTFDLKAPTLQTITIDELFIKHLKFSILDYLDPKDLKDKMLKDFPNYLQDHSQEWPWEDYFFLLFLNEIEPHFKDIPFLLVDKFPAPLAALSTISKEDHRHCERFEVYMYGIEVANCFNELTNIHEQKKRFQHDEKIKEKLYGYKLPPPKVLIDALTRGLPPSSGIALGLERLLSGLFNKNEVYFLD